MHPLTATWTNGCFPCRCLRASCYAPGEHLPQRRRDQRADALLVEPGGLRGGDPPLETFAKLVVMSKRALGERARDERAAPLPGDDEAFALELAIRLRDGIGVDRKVRDHLAHGRELVADVD